MRHEWGDASFDWKGLDDAGVIIGQMCRRYGFFGGQIKEKWGCLRFYVNWSSLSLHSIFYAGHYYREGRLSVWLDRIDIKYIEPTLEKFLGSIWFRWQRIVYNWAYQRALKKYPHLRDEILRDADCPEFITGGMEVHNKYWITYKAGDEK